jgi:hypothetical protein
MNAIGSGTERVDYISPIENYRFAYSLVLEEVVSSPGSTLVISSHPSYENNPIAGATAGSIINIFV